MYTDLFSKILTHIAEIDKTLLIMPKKIIIWADFQQPVSHLKLHLLSIGEELKRYKGWDVEIFNFFKEIRNKIAHNSNFSTQEIYQIAEINVAELKPLIKDLHTVADLMQKNNITTLNGLKNSFLFALLPAYLQTKAQFLSNIITKGFKTE
jgi:hypothetical protein